MLTNPTRWFSHTVCSKSKFWDLVGNSSMTWNPHFLGHHKSTMLFLHNYQGTFYKLFIGKLDYSFSLALGCWLVGRLSLTYNSLLG